MQMMFVKNEQHATVTENFNIIIMIIIYYYN